MTAKTVMIVGSSSSAGKSLLATALCHSFARRGVRVAPYKAQNMSNNAAVCPGGGEIGRAQALQARAAGLEPHVDFNPVLIKPEADAASQVVVLGRPYKRMEASTYYDYKQAMWGYATAALDRLRAQYDLIVMEGAGSPVELNLKAGDIVNMPMAAYADAPVLLVGDIDRGGIFAQLLGTLWLLEPDERQRVRGLIVNKFRGDLALFADGVRILEERAGVPVLGVVPYLHELGLPEEDAVALDTPAAQQAAAGQIDIAVIRLPLISNFDDFDPFRSDPGVRVRFVSSAAALGQPDAICLPGTKSTLADLAWLRKTGLAQAIADYAGRGGAVVGICGGYQMLGEVIRDPAGMESAQGEARGLGLLPADTIFAGEKETRRTHAQVLGGPGWLGELEGLAVDGYEIHMGRSRSRSPWLAIDTGKAAQRPDGAISADGRIWGCYLHGIFASARLRRAWLGGLGWQAPNGNGHSGEAHFDLEEQRFTQALTRLTDAVEAALDMQILEAIIWGS